MFTRFLVRTGLKASAALAVLWGASHASAQVLDAAFPTYNSNNLGALPAGIPTPYGGLAFISANELLVAGNATAAGGIYSVLVDRDPVTNHIIGFDPLSVTCLSPGAFSDGGGLAYDNIFGVMVVSNSSVVSSVQQVNMSTSGVTCLSSLPAPTLLTGPTFPISGLGILPVPGLGFSLKAISQADDKWYDFSATFNGTDYTFTPGLMFPLEPASGSRGLAYPGGCSPPFLGPTVFVCENALDNIAVYLTMGNENPDLSTRQVFATFPGVVGATFDRITGDLVTCSTSSIGVIDGFVIPTNCPCEFNRNGFLNSQDFFDFLKSFFAGNGYANINCDSIVNSQDFFDFLACYFAGC